MNRIAKVLLACIALIGVLRALGYQPHEVLFGMLAESALTAGLGAVVGIAVGLEISYVFVRNLAANVHETSEH